MCLNFDATALLAMSPFEQTRASLHVAKGHTRIVIGGRGPFIEFLPGHLIWDNLLIPDDEKYQLDHLCKDQVYYVGWRTKCVTELSIRFRCDLNSPTERAGMDSEIDRIISHGVDYYWITCCRILFAVAHSKIMIIDKVMGVSGSFNFTKATEEENAENVIIIKSKELAGIHMENWMKHRQHLEPYAARY
jgi:phosphatidylserine/phosphatidylglycerophosphate/cardiolipin synthase-like enzyme